MKYKPRDWFATGIKKEKEKTKQFYRFMFIMFIHTDVTAFLHFTHETVQIRNIYKKKIKDEKQLRK